MNKLDSSAKEKVQHGGDPMHVGAARGWSWWEGDEGEYDHAGVYSVGFKGKGDGKGNGKGKCYKCGSSGHFAEARPCFQKGKSTGKGF